jgi:hypothetical protein
MRHQVKVTIIFLKNEIVDGYFKSQGKVKCNEQKGLIIITFVTSWREIRVASDICEGDVCISSECVQSACNIEKLGSRSWEREKRVGSAPVSELFVNELGRDTEHGAYGFCEWEKGKESAGFCQRPEGSGFS